MSPTELNQMVNAQSSSWPKCNTLPNWSAFLLARLQPAS